MIRRTRGILFFSLVFLFFITICVTFFYSLGWRFDFKKWQATEPGIFYFKIWPKSVDISINGKPKAKTDFLFATSQLENYTPGFYTVEVTKDGYWPWKKNLEIKQREVTEAKNITLIPKNPVFSSLSEKAINFYPAPSNKRALLTEESETGWDLELLELGTNTKIQIAKDDDLISLYNTTLGKTNKKFFVDIKEVSFAKDSKRAVIKIDLYKDNKKNGKGSAFILLELWKSPVSVSILDYLPASTEKLEFSPIEYRKSIAFVYHPEKSSFPSYDTVEIDTEDKTVSDVLRKDIITYVISDSDIYYLDTNGFIYKTNFEFSNGEKLNTEPVSVKPTTLYNLYYFASKFSGNLFLKEGNNLYSFNKDIQTLEKISESIKEIKISPENKKLVLINNNEIKVLFLEQKYDQPTKEKGEKVFVTRFSETIKDTNWYTENYLIFSVGDKIKISEIDERDNINVYDFASFSDPKIFWNQSDKKIYILSEGNLLYSDKIAP